MQEAEYKSKGLKERKAEVERLGRDGNSKYAIAKATGEHRRTVERWLVAAGVSTTSPRYEVGLLGERLAQEAIQAVGIECELTSHIAPYDLLTSKGVRIEVKTCGSLKYSRLNHPIAAFDTSPERGLRTDKRPYTKNYTESCDFIVLVFLGNDTDARRFWVCEPKDLPATNVAISLYPRYKSAKWPAFENRFDLIAAAHHAR